MIAQIMSVYHAGAFTRCGHERRRQRLPGVFCCGCVAVLAARHAARIRSGTRVAAQDDIITHFKYGSVGTEGTVGLPYPIWRVLPVLFADKLPKRPGEGCERLGFIFENGLAARIARSARATSRIAFRWSDSTARPAIPERVRESPTQPAADHSRHAGAPDGPAGVREFPDGVRQRSAIRGRHADRSDPQAGSGVLVVHLAACTGSW